MKYNNDLFRKSTSTVLMHSVVLFSILSASTTSFAAQSIEGKNYSNWARPAITAIAEKEMLPPSMVNDKDFKQNITREEFAELVVMLYENQKGASQASGDAFSDTDNALIEKAYNLGLVTGYPDGTFKPDKQITREEVSALVRGVYQKLGIDPSYTGQPSNTGILSQFKDRAKIGGWAQNEVAFSVEKGIMAGNADKTFNPKGNTTKQEAISIVNALAGGKVAPVTPPVVTPPSNQQQGTLSPQQMERIYNAMPQGRDKFISQVNELKLDDRQEMVTDFYKDKTHPSSNKLFISENSIYFPSSKHISGIEQKLENGKVYERVFYISVNYKNINGNMILVNTSKDTTGAATDWVLVN